MDFHCTACRILVPAAKQVVGKALGTAIGGAVGTTTRSPGGLIGSALIGLIVGAVVDELAAPICGHCGGPLSRLGPA